MISAQQLFEQALKVRAQAYAPYSHFAVGAAVLSSGGKIYCGCNVENASYPCGTCAEAGAIAAMVADGERQIAAVLVAADSACILPCGNCLQKIAEFGSKDTVIYSADLKQIVKTQKLGEILPQSFSAGDMQNA